MESRESEGAKESEGQRKGAVAADEKIDEIEKSGGKGRIITWQ